MARIIHDDQGGSSSSEGQLTIMQADGQSQIALPAGDFMSQGEMLREGQDLILQSSDGSEIIIEGYFSALTPPLLTTAQGSALTPELVQSFVKSAGPVEYAANGTENDASAVGIVKEVSGDATVTRTDGSTEKVTLGMDIHQGDIVETSAEGAVNIVFLDESSFAISNDARLAIDEYVFDPATQAGETNVSILRGMFVFTSGLIGRDDPDDVSIETPVGSIGIRGTTIAGRISPDGESQITVIEGAIVIRNGVTEVTLAEQYQTVTLTGFDQQIQMAGTLDSSQMKASYGMLGTVNAGFFNTLNTQTESEGEPQEPADEAAPTDETAPADAAPTETPADPTTEGSLEAEQPVVASYDIFSDPLNTDFDLSALPSSDNPFDSDKNVSASLLGATGAGMFVTDSRTAPALATMIIEANVTDAVPPPPLLPLEVVVQLFVDDDAIAGDVVGRVFTTLPFPNVTMAFLNVPLEGGSPIFELVLQAPGVYNVVLTAAGETAANAAALNSILGNIEVAATLPDGRTTAITAPASYGDSTVLPPPTITPAATLLLDSIGSNGYEIMGGAGQGLGYSAAFLGDLDRNGTNDFAVATDNVSIGQIRRFGGAIDISVGSASPALTLSNSGDLNGDGLLDFIIGSPYSDPAGNTDSGRVTIVSGNFPTSSTTIEGSAAGNLLGSSVAMTDYNGDGHSDAFIGAKGAAGSYGQVLRVEGNDAYTWAANSSTLFSTGIATGELHGISMVGLQDFNNDGFGDVAVAGMLTSTTGYVDLYYGNSGGTAAPNTIITFDVDNFNIPLASLGDVNGDGASDLMIGATGFNANADGIVEGRGIVAFGGGGTMNIDAAAGSSLTGMGSAGDFNGDGYDDIFVSMQTGSTIDAYVIYGHAGLSGTITLDSAWMSANQGSYYHMTLDLGVHGNPADAQINGTSVGDQNADGFEDLLITSPDLNNGNGGFYVVYGRGDPFDLAGPDPEIHTDAGPGANAGMSMITSSNGDGLVGGGGVNMMANLNGGNIHTDVSFQSGQGADMINLHGTGDVARVIDGGFGYDELRLFTTVNVDFRNISEMAGIEEIAFAGSTSQSMTIGLNDVFSLLQTSQDQRNVGEGMRYTLFVTNDGAGAKSVTFDDPNNNLTMPTAGFSMNGTYNDGSSIYDIYTFGSGYQLLIEQGVSVTVN